MDLMQAWLTVMEPKRPRDAVDAVRINNERRAACSTLAAVALPRITLPLAPHFDWDRCRLNVTHLVSPGLMRWK